VGGLVYYSAGVAGLGSFGAAQALPDDGPLWLAARLLLDGAGGLFGLYLVAGLGLAVAGRFMAARDVADRGDRDEEVDPPHRPVAAAPGGPA
jgi:hypothetical protein